MNEWTILASIAELLGCELWRLQRAEHRLDPDPKWELLVAIRSSHIYARIHEQYLEFYTRFAENPYARRCGGMRVWARLDLAAPGNLTRAQLRATIKRATQAYWEAAACDRAANRP